MQVTKADLDGSLRYLNSMSKRKYVLDGAYGGWRLGVMAKQGSGQSDVGPRGSKSEVYYQIQTIIKYMEFESDQRAFEHMKRGFGPVKLVIS